MNEEEHEIGVGDCVIQENMKEETSARNKAEDRTPTIMYAVMDYSNYKITVGRLRTIIKDTLKQERSVALREAEKRKCFVVDADNFDDFSDVIKDMAMRVRQGICPIWQCGGILLYVEDRTNWEEPDLKCRNCGTQWLIQLDEKRLREKVSAE